MYLEHVSRSSTLSLCLLFQLPYYLYLRRKSWVLLLCQAGKGNLLCSGPLCLLVVSGRARQDGAPEISRQS